MMRTLLEEMARVSKLSVILFEQVDSTINGTELRMARPISYYAELMAENGFRLLDQKMIGIVASYYACGAIRKLFNPRSRQEGEAPTQLSTRLQSLVLPITKMLDRGIKIEKDLARMHFVRSGVPG